MYHVYVIKSISTGKTYIGHTDKLQERLSQHKDGSNKATKFAHDWNLVHTEEYFTRSLDSNQRLLAPKASALAKLSYTP